MSWSDCPEAKTRAGDEQQTKSAVELVLTPQTKDLGGFEVRRALPSSKRQMVGPFIFFDEMGPAEFERGKGIDVRPHPHIGLATITYLFDGAIMHRDSLGTELAIEPGDVNWMKAGRGIVHSERTPEANRGEDGHPLHGIQAWLALPKDQEQAEPAFVHYPESELPEIDTDGVSIRLIAGSLFGQESPVKVDWPTLYAEIHMLNEASISVDVDYDERALYIVSGEVNIGDQTVQAGSMVIFTAGAVVNIQAGKTSHLMLLGGKTMDGPRHIWWNFVASDMELIEQAKDDWQHERFDAVPGETERIPLPE